MAETSTMLPTIQAFQAAHRLPEVTVVTDAGMVSAANQKAIDDLRRHRSSTRRRPGRL